MVTLTAILGMIGVIVLAVPKQSLDDGTQVWFGQKIEEVSALAGKPAVDNPSSVARKGIDKQIRLKGVTLSFDSGLLQRMVFSDNYQFKNPPCPFVESWKNFEPIEGKSIKSHMTRAEFLAYLALWESRAKARGKTKVDFREMAEGQYRVSFTKESIIDMVRISFGPSRSMGRGGLWHDSWRACFTTEGSVRLFRVRDKPVGVLDFLSVNEDEFNTNGRRKAVDG